MNYFRKVLTASAVVLMCFFLTASAVPWAQDGEQAATGKAGPEKPDKQPSITFNETNHDFGETHQNAKLKHAFVFKNTGTGVLNIQSVKAGWGCTAALASASEIPPGGEGKIDVTFRPGSTGGVKKKTIRVLTNDPAQKRVILSVSAEVKVVLAVKPSRLNFGRVNQAKDTVTTQFARLDGADKDTVKITSVHARSPFIKAEVNLKGFDNDPLKQIKITLLPGMKVGPIREHVVLYTDHKQVKTLRMYVSGEVTGNILVSPNYLSFGLISPGRAEEKTITLRATPGTSFAVVSATSSVPELQIRTETVTEGSEYRVHVRVGEDFKKAVLKGDLIITTDSETEKEKKVRIFGRLKKPRGRKPHPAAPPHDKKTSAEQQ